MFIEASIEIDASAETVWQVVADFARYPQWNPFIFEVSGEIREERRVAVALRLPSAGTWRFRPVILVSQAPSEIRWLGHTLFRGVLDGEHIFLIQPLSADKVRFVQREKFRGLLAPLVAPFFSAATQRGFEAMNSALKFRCESADTAPGAHE